MGVEVDPKRAQWRKSWRSKDNVGTSVVERSEGLAIVSSIDVKGGSGGSDETKGTWSECADSAGGEGNCLWYSGCDGVSEGCLNLQNTNTSGDGIELIVGVVECNSICKNDVCTVGKLERKVDEAVSTDNQPACKNQ